ncbi:MAG: sigma-70 family RNA polymerase sigma factor [Sediminibacterium sp.]|uniref:RNA polymerase sigma factor n=1 Tax=Sediminibacterium sp. TaxID=1917865 RepID=UPI002ABB0A68|nr:sigma-70 family RNA polymerase sigma factor [Sediminibacterium sp.]MDZ4072044.1 sigma-70 family RNA polymerase sigma factor [Sediminibacterium sp.]
MIRPSKGMDQAWQLPANMSDSRGKHITEVINTYSKRLMGFIRKRVSSEADAEDILQDVFYQFIGNTTPIEQLTSWLFTVTRNKITDKQRKKKPELLEDLYASDSDEGFEWSDLFFDDENNPESEYMRSLFWDALYTALNELPAPQRDAFVLNEIEGIPFKEIAEQTGDTINTLISRKRYAVLHLRERLGTLKNELLNHS